MYNLLEIATAYFFLPTGFMGGSKPAGNPRQSPVGATDFEPGPTGGIYSGVSCFGLSEPGPTGGIYSLPIIFTLPFTIYINLCSLLTASSIEYYNITS